MVFADQKLLTAVDNGTNQWGPAPQLQAVAKKNSNGGYQSKKSNKKLHIFLQETSLVHVVVL